MAEFANRLTALVISELLGIPPELRQPCHQTVITLLALLMTQPVVSGVSPGAWRSPEAGLPTQSRGALRRPVCAAGDRAQRDRCGPVYGVSLVELGESVA